MAEYLTIADHDDDVLGVTWSRERLWITIDDGTEAEVVLSRDDAEALRDWLVMVLGSGEGNDE